MATIPPVSDTVVRAHDSTLLPIVGVQHPEVRSGRSELAVLVEEVRESTPIGRPARRVALNDSARAMAPSPRHRVDCDALRLLADKQNVVVKELSRLICLICRTATGRNRGEDERTRDYRQRTAEHHSKLER